MMHSFSLLALIVALTTQVYALNVQLGASGNFTASGLLDFENSDSFVSQANCTTQCDPVLKTIQGCGTDDSCVCKNETGMAMLFCEQCLFTSLVDRNIPAPNPLIGSQAALTAFVAACHAPPVNTTVMPLKMTIPPSMDGPLSIKLGTPATVVAVTVGGLLGGSFLLMFSTLE